VWSLILFRKISFVIFKKQSEGIYFMKKKGAFIAVFSLLASINLSAATLQQFVIVNQLSNPNATNGVAGQTSTAVLINFYLSGGGAPCQSLTLNYNNSTTVSTGTGFSCTTAVTSITFTPVASAVGTTYAALSPFTPTVGKFITQISINEHSGSGNDPVFDTTNGLTVTPGTAAISTQ